MYLLFDNSKCIYYLTIYDLLFIYDFTIWLFLTGFFLPPFKGGQGWVFYYLAIYSAVANYSLFTIPFSL